MMDTVELKDMKQRYNGINSVTEIRKPGFFRNFSNLYNGVIDFDNISKTGVPRSTVKGLKRHEVSKAIQIGLRVCTPRAAGNIRKL